MKVRVTTKTTAWMPQRSTTGAACFDLFSPSSHVVPAHGSRVIDTGVAFEIPAGYTMLVFSRSGMGAKQGVRLANCVGVIDSDYRGSVGVVLHNDRSVGYDVRAGDKIAQVMIVPVPDIEFEWAEELSVTARGAGGFGSTGI